MSEHADVIFSTIERIRPLLAGKPPEIQGIILAELLATHIAGHITDPPDRTAEFHKRILSIHIDAVRKLIPLFAAEIHGRPI